MLIVATLTWGKDLLIQPVSSIQDVHRMKKRLGGDCDRDFVIFDGAFLSPIKLDNAVQETTGTVKLRATIPNSDHRFWPGRFVRVRLILETIHGAVLIPAAAPQRSAKGMFVYVVNNDSIAESRPVKLGQRQEDLVVVDEGLKAGDRVVVSGQLAVVPDAKVQVQESGALAAKNGGGS